jgi:hypothetical protein
VAYDWDRDGKKDLLIGDTQGYIRFYRNIGTDASPAFGTSTFLTAGGSRLDVYYYSRLDVADWDNNGAADIVCGDYYGNVWVYLGFYPDTVPPQAVAWSSAATHGGLGEVLLGIPDDGSFCEPRAPGIHRLVVQFSEAINPASFTPSAVEVTVTGANGSNPGLSGVTVITSTRDGDTQGVIDFTQPLASLVEYEVKLQGVTDVAGNLLAGDRDRIVRALIGDANGDGAADAGDYMDLKRSFGGGISLATACIDFDCSGTIDCGDLTALTGSLGQGFSTSGSAREPAAEPADAAAEAEPVAASVDTPEAGILAAIADSSPLRLAIGLTAAPRADEERPTPPPAGVAGPSKSSAHRPGTGRAGLVVTDVLQLAAPWPSGAPANHEAPDAPWMTGLTVDTADRPRRDPLDPLGSAELLARK